MNKYKLRRQLSKDEWDYLDKRFTDREMYSSAYALTVCHVIRDPKRKISVLYYPTREKEHRFKIVPDWSWSKNNTIIEYIDKKPASFFKRFMPKELYIDKAKRGRCAALISDNLPRGHKAGTIFANSLPMNLDEFKCWIKGEMKKETTANINRTFQAHTSMYEYFDKNGHDDGYYCSAGMEYKDEAAQILEEELDKAFPEDEVEVRPDIVPSLHNRCRLAVCVNYLGARVEVDIRTDCTENKLKYIEYFDEEEFKVAFKKAAERFGDEDDVF